MYKLRFTLLILFLNVIIHSIAQNTEKFDITNYSVPADWVKETGNDFVAYTVVNDQKGEYARILLFASQPVTGNIEQDFATEWKELVLENYHPGNFTNTGVSDYKDGWVSKIGVAPFQYKNKNHAVVLNMLIKGNTKISSVFISNTTAYQKVFEDFGSSLSFGNSGSVSNQQQVKSAEQIPNPPPVNEPVIVNQPHNAGFTYTSSNFDDGWISTIQKDWVMVERNNARVYLYYAVPYNADNFSGTGVMDRDYYWDNYVALQFRITSKQYNDAGEFVSSLKPKYVEGQGTDPISGRQVFVAMTLSVSPNAAQLTVASFPDEGSFRQAFPSANDKFTSDLTNMSRYNKFAIGTDDFLGTWQSGGTQMTQWYDAITGAYAGATMAASSATFTFQPGNIYISIQNGATGAVGAMNTFQQENKGNSTVSNWNMILTNRYQGKTSNFDAHYQAVRGGRLLYLNNNAGEYYLLVKIK